MLSFTYIRKDIGELHSLIYQFGLTGFGILLGAKEDDEYSTRCIYPVNGGTLERDDHGCGGFLSKKLSDDEDNSSCKAKDISTAEQWVAAFDGTSSGVVCSFSTHNAGEFYEAIRTTILLFEKNGSIGNNEIVLNTSTPYWNSSDPSEDHIQAIWYNPKASNSSKVYVGLAGAQKEQEEYYTVTGKFVPIVSIDPDNTDSPFSYSETDQKVNP